MPRHTPRQEERGPGRHGSRRDSSPPEIDSTGSFGSIRIPRELDTSLYDNGSRSSVALPTIPRETPDRHEQQRSSVLSIYGYGPTVSVALPNRPRETPNRHSRQRPDDSLDRSGEADDFPNVHSSQRGPSRHTGVQQYASRRTGEKDVEEIERQLSRDTSTVTGDISSVLAVYVLFGIPTDDYSRLKQFITKFANDWERSWDGEVLDAVLRCRTTGRQLEADRALNNFAVFLACLKRGTQSTFIQDIEIGQSEARAEVSRTREGIEQLLRDRARYLPRAKVTSRPDPSLNQSYGATSLFPRMASPYAHPGDGYSKIAPAASTHGQATPLFGQAQSRSRRMFIPAEGIHPDLIKERVDEFFGRNAKIEYASLHERPGYYLTATQEPSPEALADLLAESKILFEEERRSNRHSTIDSFGSPEQGRRHDIPSLTAGYGNYGQAVVHRLLQENPEIVKIAVFRQPRAEDLRDAFGRRHHQQPRQRMITLRNVSMIDKDYDTRGVIDLAELATGLDYNLISRDCLERLRRGKNLPTYDGRISIFSRLVSSFGPVELDIQWEDGKARQETFYVVASGEYPFGIVLGQKSIDKYQLLRSAARVELRDLAGRTIELRVWSPITSDRAQITPRTRNEPRGEGKPRGGGPQPPRPGEEDIKLPIRHI